jgi:hypothetical protein
MDPRVKTPREVLGEQFDLSMRLYDGIARSDAALRELRALRAALKDARSRGAPADLAQRLTALDEQAGALESGRPDAPGLPRINSQLASLLDVLQDADVAPTQQARSAITDVLARTDDGIARWGALAPEVRSVNGLLRSAGLPELPATR